MMKSILRSITFFLATIASSFLVAQNWAPEGAVWHYSHVNPWLGHNEYNSIQVEGDTIIQGIQCQHLVKLKGAGNLRPLEEFMYEDNGQVFYYHEEQDSFFLLYDFNLLPGDTLTITATEPFPFGMGTDFIKIRIDSLSYLDINGTSRVVQHITQLEAPGYNSEISFEMIEGIGATTQMFYWNSPYIADISKDTDLRCYQDPTLGQYSTGIAFVCDDVLLNGEGPEGPIQDLAIYPNPAREFIGWSVPLGRYGVQVWDMRGKILFEGEVTSNQLSMDGYSNGLYFIMITDRLGQRYGAKFRRQSIY